ncbi:flagellar assembly protein FliH [Marinimicrobium sp. C2-29]|uniref:flagellar assembly protein FliH n=1 Tax=Marinimicrobium sp. C2-29 TaxID=3139825 RepID=UPI0031398EFC
MTQKKLVNRIPAEELQDYKTWVLPPIHGERDRVLPSAEREAREQAETQRKRQGERVEDVNYTGTGSGMSADEMQRIVDAAEKEGREQGYQAGFEQGQAEGYEAGEKQGWEEMRQKLAAEQQRFQHLVQSLLDPLEEQDDALEKLLLDTVCTLTKSLVQRELLTDSSQVLEQVRAAVAALPAGAGNLRLFLNPDDLVLVEAYAEERELDWQFRGDETLLPGGCRVETQTSQVDFSVEHRLKQQLEAFVNRQLVNEESEDESALDEPDFDHDRFASDAPEAPDAKHSGEAPGQTPDSADEGAPSGDR